MLFGEAGALPTVIVFKEKTMSRIAGPRRQPLYVLVLVVLMILAGIAMAQQGVLAQIGLDSDVFLPLVFKGEAGATIPLR
jgi:hypothetical protein